MNKILKEKYNKKCNDIIGINKKRSESGTTLTPSITLKQLNDIIYRFNNHKFDILIGTSAIEEGLDIQSCNAVLALVELNTPKSFIQIKGRARKSNSHFYIFTNSKEEEAKKKIRNFINFGKKMKDLFGGDIIKDFRREDYIREKPPFLYDMDLNTHSKITMDNVTIFFNEIKQQIISMGIYFETKEEEREIKSLAEKQEYEYICKIYIKTDLKDLEKDFPYTSPQQFTKDNAIKCCYFYTLKALKKYKYLDSHLKLCKFQAY